LVANEHQSESFLIGAGRGELIGDTNPFQETSIMVDLIALRAANAHRWAHAKLTRGPEFSPVAQHLCSPAAKQRYLAVSVRTGVPWFVIAVIHQRECAQSWAGSIAQGDSWNKSRFMCRQAADRSNPGKTRPSTPSSTARLTPRNKDWSIGGILTLLEQYNGLGYASRGRASPYIWSGTDQYVAGKYVANHVFDASAVDHQLGCAGLILVMAAIDATVQAGTPAPSNVVPFVRTTAQPVIAPHPDSVPPKPSIANPAPGSIGAWLSHFFNKAA
jgi:lysozyme family protein